MQAPAIKIPGPRLCLRPAAEREAEVAIERRMVASHPPAKPHAMDHPFIGRDQNAARSERASVAVEHE